MSTGNGERFVITSDIRQAIKGREAEILDGLGIPWRSGKPHINCPYRDHQDRNPSWRWDEHKHRAICTCGSHSILDVLTKVEGIDFYVAKLRAAELLKRTDLIRVRRQKKRPPDEETSAAGSDSPGPAGCRLADYAQAKGLPIDFLRSLGIAEITYRGAPAIKIPYHAPDRSVVAMRFRIALEGEDKFRWRKWSRLCLYGAHDAKHLKAAGLSLLVEGESDCHTIWWHRIPGLGLPGGGTWNEERDAPLFDDVPVIYAIIEPDKGGQALLASLARSRIAPRVRLVHMPPDTKDVSALYLADPENFVVRLDALLEVAQPIPQQVIAPSSAGPDQKVDDRPALIIDDADLTRTARALRDRLAERAGLFDRGTPVKLVRDAMSGGMVARQLTVEGVVHEAHRVAYPVKQRMNADGSILEVPVTLPNRVARLYLDMRGDWNLRVLNGITTAPILSSDGSVLGRHGYDEGTGLWCDAVETPPMPPMVPMPLAAAALLRVRATFHTFPFADAPRVWDAH